MNDVSIATPTYGKHGPKATMSFKRNLLPVFAGIAAMFVILAVLNAQWLEAQYKYHFSKPVATSVAQVPVPASGDKSSPAITDTKSPNPELGPQVTIPGIGVQAPVMYDNGTAEWQIQVALRSGVVHYDDSAKPGETGNVVMFGHSSGVAWAPGKYKFVFTLLNKVVPNDAVYVDYNGTRYTYKVTGTEVVAPTDTAVLQQGNGHNLTLITCTPVGTSTNRLIVHAKQISPVPTKDSGTAAKAAPSNLKVLPGTAH